MNLSTKLDEKILAELEATINGWALLPEDADPSKFLESRVAAILQAVMDSLPEEKEEPIDLGQLTYEEGYNQALRDIKDRLEVK